MPVLELELVDLEKPALDSDTLEQAWAVWSDKRHSYHTKFDMDIFRAFVGKRVHELDQDIILCSHHEEPVFAEGTVNVGGSWSGRPVCETCMDENYTYCDGCDNQRDADTLSSTLGDEARCESCISSYYSWCEECDGYYADDESYDHEHDDGCECESPVRSFTVRNDGEAPLKNDTRVTVTLPAGVIDSLGLSRIASLLRDKAWAMSNTEGQQEQARALYNVVREVLPNIGSDWQTREGNFTKRLSRQAWKSFGVKIDPEILSTIGNYARECSSSVSEHSIEVTRNLNLSAYDFGHEDSCWWQSYAYSRCSLKSNGGLGLRTFDSSGEVSGRAWVQPLRMVNDGDPSSAMGPTFDTESPDAFVTYNGYGDLDGYTAARLLAHMMGWTYRKVGLNAGNQYVNSGGYLVAPENIASKYNSGSVCLDMDDHSNLYRTESNTSSL